MSLIGNEIYDGRAGGRRARPAAGPPRLHLVGTPDPAAVAALVLGGERLREAGHPRAVIDLSRLDSCSGRALEAILTMVRGRSAPSYRVEGTRGDQFVDLLAGTSATDLPALLDRVRLLLDATGGSPSPSRCTAVPGGPGRADRTCGSPAGRRLADSRG